MREHAARLGLMLVLSLMLSASILGAQVSTAPRGERRLTPLEFDFGTGAAGGTGTSGAAGIRTVVLKGNPDSTGLYTIMLRVPAHTRIPAHRHADDRVATVVAGAWYFGYGERADSAAVKKLPVGSFYTEPADRAHFAETRDEPAIVQITGYGPSSTKYVDATLDPRRTTP